MNRKKKKAIIFMSVILIIIIILLIVGVLLAGYREQQEVPVKEDGMKLLEKKLEKKVNMLIYVTEDDCELCKPIDKMIKFYEEAYNLEFYYTNKEDLTNSELREYFELEEQAIELPSVVYIRDRMLKGIDNKILTEDYFRDYLIEYGFLDKAYYENDYRITYEEFKKNYASSEKQILFFYNYGSNVYNLGESGEKKEYKDADEIRKELIKLSKEKKFTYRVVFYNSSGSDEIYKEITTSLKKEEINGPFIVITESNDVVDYLVPEKISSVSKFLEKNKIIN